MAYKITTNKSRSLISEWDEENDRFSLQYEKNKWVKGEYPLFVFKRIKDAEYFLKTDYMSVGRNYIIWRCQTRAEKGLRRVNFVAMFLRGVTRLWNEIESRGLHEIHQLPLETLNRKVSVRRAPCGTYVVDEVKLTEIVRICEKQ